MENKTNRTEELSENKIYCLKEIEPILGVTRVTLLKYVNNGTLHAIKIGNRWMVTKADLDNLIHPEGNR